MSNPNKDIIKKPHSTPDYYLRATILSGALTIILLIFLGIWVDSKLSALHTENTIKEDELVQATSIKLNTELTLKDTVSSYRNGVDKKELHLHSDTKEYQAVWQKAQDKDWELTYISQQAEILYKTKSY